MSSITDAWGYFEFEPNFYQNHSQLIDSYMEHAIELGPNLFDFLHKVTNYKFYFTGTAKNWFINYLDSALNELGFMQQKRHIKLYNALYKAHSKIHFTYNDYSPDDRKWLLINCDIRPNHLTNTPVEPSIFANISMNIKDITTREKSADNHSLVLNDIEDGLIFDESKPDYELGIQEFIKEYLKPAIKVSIKNIDSQDEEKFYHTLIDLIKDYAQNNPIYNGAILLDDFETPADMLDLVNKALKAKIKG